MADERPIIVKRIKKVEGGHHGGAWKVAYADFVTAMMAFFLLLWLLNAVTEEQKKGIAAYFRPTLAVQNTSATFTILAGQAQPIEDLSGGASQQTEDEEDEEQAMQQAPATGEGDRPQTYEGEQPDIGRGNEPEPGKGEKPVDLEEAEAAVAANERKQLEQIKNDIKNAISEDPELKELEKNLKIDQTEDGIRIQLLDQEKISMFPSGSAVMNPRSKELLEKVAEVVKSLPNKIEISGHTDAKPYPGSHGYTNWELSADRANASRRVLVAAGISADRLIQIRGRADTDPFVEADPFDPQNRRISIVLLREPRPAQAPSEPAASSAAELNTRSGPPAELVP
ncbi:flagellar motor protein MotB [Dongia deserti]|uniref:flagellar motor protein MotB n=1 Tax=Dongia deserti TaxID=2268030 RepID=UPI000E65423D|nr:flagellar motor protein MotB [Dongia deserti]